jgi:hypothetical protein
LIYWKIPLYLGKRSESEERKGENVKEKWKKGE